MTDRSLSTDRPVDRSVAACPGCSGSERVRSFVTSMRSWLGLHAPAPTLETSVAALMTHAAWMRGTASLARLRRIESVLCQYLGGDAAAARSLVQQAQQADDRATDLHGFIRVIDAHLSHDDRLAVFGMVAHVVFADESGAEEEGYLRLLGGLLGISDHERALLQNRARADSAQPASAVANP